ncbi:MAG: hypothetical protein ABEI07_02045 [Candidatus Nanohaloarchaea archaeon]
MGFHGGGGGPHLLPVEPYTLLNRETGSYNMGEMLDPTPSYILLFASILGGGALIGFFFGRRLGLLPSLVVMALLGFVAGVYTSRESVEPVGSLTVSLVAASVLSYFLEPGFFLEIGVFLAAVLAGLKVERR